jgi:hypothetical protein
MTAKVHKPRPLLSLDHVTEVDWARLAAFIDGEGCIRVSSRTGYLGRDRRNMCLQINISNTDPRLPQWLKETFGGGVYLRDHNHKLNVKWANCFSWIVSTHHARVILERCLPYFVIKRDQAEIAIAFQKTMQGKGRSRRTPDHIIEQRWKYRDALSALKGRSSRKAGYKERNQTMEQIPAPEGLLN